MKTFDGYKKRNLTDKDYALLAGGGHKALDTLFSALSSDTTNAIKITVGGTEKSITTDTLKTSLGLGSNAYTSTAYLPLAGGTMTGALNFKNDTWNLMGDDAYIGDCNVAGMIGIKGANAATPGFALYNNSGALLGKLYASNDTLNWSGGTIAATIFSGNASTASLLALNTSPASTVATAVGGWTPFSNKVYVYRQRWTNTSAGSDTADLAIYLDGNLTANMCLDGYYFSLLGFKKSGSSDSYILLGGGGHKAISDFFPSTGGSLYGPIEFIPKTVSNQSSNAWSGGSYHNAHNNIVFHGDSSGVSGMVFLSDKTDSAGTITNINKASDRGFILFHAHGITTQTAENTNPTLATSGENATLVIGVGNDAGTSGTTADWVVLQTPSDYIYHQKGASRYNIYDSGNFTSGTGAGNWCAGNDSRLSNSRPASDVYAWAKAATKPSYNFSEISAGNITMGDGANYFLYRTDSAQAEGSKLLRAGFYYHTTGRESVVFANQYAHTGWIFVNGIDPVSRLAWNNLGVTPALQIHHNAIYINRAVRDADTADYNLYVNGTAYVAGTLNVRTGGIWVQGGSEAGSDNTRMSLVAGMPNGLAYNTAQRGVRIYSNAIAFADPYNGNSNNDSGWIRHLETTADKGLLEIAAGDDASNEEIRFRYYNTSNTVAYDILVPRKTGTIALVGDIPTKVSLLTNDSGYLTSHLSLAYYFKRVTVANNTTNDFNTFENLTFTGRGDPTTGASLSNAPWTGSGPAGGYGTLTYLWSGYGILMAWGYSSNRIYIRNKYYLPSSGAVWATSWSLIALVSDIPTKVSQLTNDSGYLTSHQSLSHLLPKSGDLYIFNTTDIPEGATNLSNTATAHKINFYRNGFTIPYQMDNANDGGMFRVRGTSESNCIAEIATWDDSGAGETILFNYYPTTSLATPTYSVTVPKKSGTIALSGESQPANGGNSDTVDGVHLEWNGSLAASSTTWLAGWTSDGAKIKAVKQSDLSVSYATSSGRISLVSLIGSPNTVALYKTSVHDSLNSNYGIGKHVVISDSIIGSWGNDSATYYPSSVGDIIHINGGYDGGTYGQYLVASWGYGIGMLKCSEGKFENIKWFSTTDHTHSLYLQLAGGTMTGNLVIPYGKLVIGSDGGDSYSYRVIKAYTSNTSQYINFGCAPSSGNAGEIGFHYIGSGNAGNNVSIGFYGKQVLNITYDNGSTFTGNCTATNFYSSSDIRLKNNISNISKSIRSFNWNDTGLKSYGLIAQEIEDEYPELVSNNDNGYKSINYTSALCMIIAKLENELDELRKRINLPTSLKSEIEQLRERVAELEQKLNDYGIL